MRRSHWSRWICLLVPAILAGCQGEEAKQPGRSAQAVEVGYVTLKPQSVPYNMDLRGRVVALATAEVRPQVDGIVRKIVFTEGREVKEGDVLYEIDDRKFKASLMSAQAEVSRTSAVTANAQLTYDRNRKLFETNAVSSQTLEDAKSALLQAEASQEAAEADAEVARINLDNATIRAPISGQIGVSAVSAGSLVTENQTTALAVIRQVDKVYVDLADTSTNLLRMRSETESGKLSRPDGQPLPARLKLETGADYDQQGVVSLADMVVGETTGTFTVRAVFPNPQRVLVPGMFVTASVEIGSLKDAFLVPQRALIRQADGSAGVYLAVDGKAKLQTVTASDTYGNNWIVMDGLKDGDKLIIDGFQKISDGADVKPVEAVIDDNGVARQDMTASPAGSAAK
ncbi:efflux RND transporter periplasmic adaptor subunit [Pannonibacter indicus]|uniref:efflux RND transporter periplasmic adaptor subunit n=1 Tax=Pannonibacter indicus TaxID=466044 RepID=UPI00391A4E31